MKTVLDPYLFMLIATVILAAIFPAHGVGRDITDIAVTFAVGLLFFLYGARLMPSAIWQGVANWRLQLLVLAGTFIFFPILGLIVAEATGPFLPKDMVMGLLYLCLLPSTVQSSIAFTSIARGNVPAALCSASVSNLIGVVITPLLVALFLSTSNEGFSFGAIEKIALQILLPFLAGQLCRPFIGNFLTKHKLLTLSVDRGSILLVVYAAFSAGMVANIWQQVSVTDLLIIILIDIIMLAIAIVTMTFTARRLCFTKQDEIAIVFCGSKKSMASGIPIATILFPASIVSLLVLPLMIFHQIQLFVCTILAQRYARRDNNKDSSL